MLETANPNIGIIILAAGSSKRFKRDKRKIIFKDGASLLSTTLQQIPECFTQKILVLRPGDEDFAKQYESDWTICIAQQAKLGMGHSLAAAIALLNGCSGVVIGLADMPFVKKETYQSIQEALLEHAIVRPFYQGSEGNPVGFQAKYFEALSELNGDNGARSILKQHKKDIYRLDCVDSGITKDIDTVAALLTNP